MKRTWGVILGGVILGIVMLILQHVLGMDSETFLKWFIVLAVLVLLITVIVNVSYHLVYMQRMKKLLPLLAAGDTARYIEGVKALLHHAKGKSLRATLTLNLSAGYIEAGRLDEGRRLLEEIPADVLQTDTLRVVCAINLTDAYVELGQPDKARAVYHAHEALFETFRRHKIYGGHIALLRAHLAIADGDRDTAREILDTAQATWQDPRLQREYAKLREALTDDTPPALG